MKSVCKNEHEKFKNLKKKLPACTPSSIDTLSTTGQPQQQQKQNQ